MTIPYDARFYAERRRLTQHAARRVLACVAPIRPFRSAVDVGCGTGTWLDTARALGATRVQGYEGDWLRPEWVDDPAIPIVRQDLRAPILAAERFDLALCLEVAEHLPEHRAAGLVADLCRLSDTVLFAAAIPGQTGDGHINEQWPGYWISHFASHGYAALDAVRPAIWDDDSIPYWYRQNTVLYVRGAAPPERRPPDLVHPAQWQVVHDRIASPSLRAALAGIVRAARRVARRALTRT